MVNPEAVRRKLTAAVRVQEPFSGRVYVEIEPLTVDERDFLVEAVKAVENLKALMFYIDHVRN